MKNKKIIDRDIEMFKKTNCTLCRMNDDCPGFSFCPYLRLVDMTKLKNRWKNYCHKKIGILVGEPPDFIEWEKQNV